MLGGLETLVSDCLDLGSVIANDESMDVSMLPRSLRWGVQLGVYQFDSASWNPTWTESQVVQLFFEQNETLIQQQAEKFQRLNDEYLLVQEEGEPEAPPTTSSQHAQAATPDSSATDMDPLTAMVMEQEAIENRKAELMMKYKKERARRKRGLTTEGTTATDESEGMDRASLVIIEKDLNRLPHPASQGTNNANGNGTTTLTPADPARMEQLKEILYLFAQEHSAIGYRQGMHEIASYLLFALELDKKHFVDAPPALFDSIVCSAYFCFEAMLSRLHLAYDVSGELALQQMSNSILSKVHQNDPMLYHHLTTSPNIPPPPIYCTRWVRLLFSREVVGYQNVFALWDEFLNYGSPMMRTLEIACSARILLLRDKLHGHNTLDQLMNVPPLQDISELTTLLRSLMQQKDSDPPVHISSPSFPDPSTLLPNPVSPPLPGMGSMGPMESPNKTPFSFSKFKQSLGQTSESLRQKIIVATNEWKKETSGGSSSGGMGNPDRQVGQGPMGMGDPLSGLLAPQVVVPPPSNTGTASPPPASVTTMAAPPTPRQYQHSQWAEALQNRILIVQNGLMQLESQEKVKVPPEVWEAVADLHKIQHEVHNYSVNMAS
eukprot:Nitzschia sp. Nitz4//scaffold31_size150131//53596//55515//NITZ4_002822-RA/size150131-processed-gene-0.105-mRNA-1//1//CDS//3329547641//2206//frame0